jgi:hypothetical protein
MNFQVDVYKYDNLKNYKIIYLNFFFENLKFYSVFVLLTSIHSFSKLNYMKLYLMILYYN